MIVLFSSSPLPLGGVSFGVLQQHKVKKVANVKDISFTLIEVRLLRILEIFNTGSLKHALKVEIKLNLELN